MARDRITPKLLQKRVNTAPYKIYNFYVLFPRRLVLLDHGQSCNFSHNAHPVGFLAHLAYLDAMALLFIQFVFSWLINPYRWCRQLFIIVFAKRNKFHSSAVRNLVLFVLSFVSLHALYNLRVWLLYVFRLPFDQLQMIAVYQPTYWRLVGSVVSFSRY